MADSGESISGTCRTGSYGSGIPTGRLMNRAGSSGDQEDPKNARFIVGQWSTDGRGFLDPGIGDPRSQNQVLATHKAISIYD